MNTQSDDTLLNSIRDHYDRLSGIYHALWGEHIHHGYWEGDAAPAQAQRRLIEILAERAGIPRGARVLDIGCGVGGSSLWLAREWGCSVHGITLSPVQAAMAARRARELGLDARVRFEVRDANRLDLPPESFDVVWVIECSEHLHNKQGFVEECARILRSGGALALCAWLKRDELPEDGRSQLVEEVCRGMLCPSLGSMRDYCGWIAASKLRLLSAEDITLRVERTWEHCAALAARPEVQMLLRMSDVRIRDFVAAFPKIRRAYAEGVMGYGMFAAIKENREAAANS